MAYYTPDRNEYGDEDYLGSVDGIFILIVIFLIYLGLSWICKKTCKTELSVRRFFSTFTHGPNISLFLFFLYHNPFKSINAFMGMVGTMIVSTFLFTCMREVFTKLTWKEIEIEIIQHDIAEKEMLENAKSEVKSKTEI